MSANPCPLILLPGFHTDMIRLCSMHMLNLGMLQTMAAECILRLCENDVYAGDTLDVQLQNSFHDIPPCISPQSLEVLAIPRLRVLGFLRPPPFFHEAKRPKPKTLPASNNFETESLNKM